MATRFLVRPKRFAASVAGIAASARVGGRFRERQIEALVRARNGFDPESARLDQWSQDISAALPALMKDGRPKRLATLSISNFAVYQMSPTQANRMRSDLPEFDVIEDAAVSLIQPPATDEKPTIDATQDLWHLERIGLPAARKAGRVGTGDGVQVAVLDSGIADHRELSGRIVPGVHVTGSRGRAVPLQGPFDSDGHGTHVAGLVCGSNVGVAPGARVVNVLCLPEGNGYVSDILLAIEWASQQPEISILNLSAGVDGFIRGFAQTLDAALAAGVLPIVAIGNEGRSRTSSPGNYALPLSVGAATKDNSIASFSGGGTMNVDNMTYTVPDVVAPGAAVWSSIRSGGYGEWDGTSMATPIVLGIAALLVERNPEIAALALRDEIEASAKDLGFAADRQGKGLVVVG